MFVLTYSSTLNVLVEKASNGKSIFYCSPEIKQNSTSKIIKLSVKGVCKYDKSFYCGAFTNFVQAKFHSDHLDFHSKVDLTDDKVRATKERQKKISLEIFPSRNFAAHIFIVKVDFRANNLKKLFNFDNPSFSSFDEEFKSENFTNC